MLRIIKLLIMTFFLTSTLSAQHELDCDLTPELKIGSILFGKQMDIDLAKTNFNISALVIDNSKKHQIQNYRTK